eukprot:IDg7173t1
MHPTGLNALKAKIDAEGLAWLQLTRETETFSNLPISVLPDINFKKKHEILCGDAGIDGLFEYWVDHCHILDGIRCKKLGFELVDSIGWSFLGKSRFVNLIFVQILVQNRVERGCRGCRQSNMSLARL